MQAVKVTLEHGLVRRLRVNTRSDQSVLPRTRTMLPASLSVEVEAAAFVLIPAVMNSRSVRPRVGRIGESLLDFWWLIRVCRSHSEAIYASLAPWA